MSHPHRSGVIGIGPVGAADPWWPWMVVIAQIAWRVMTRRTSMTAWVTLLPRGQASVQLKVVRHRTPSRLSKMNRCALTIVAGPT